jgi:acyl carrier protein
MTAQLAEAPRKSEACTSHDIPATVMTVLRGIRPAQSDGRPYGETTGLAGAGFSSMDMVKVMLGVEATFDLMIPQEQITPENFQCGQAIATMIARLKAAH